MTLTDTQSRFLQRYVAPPPAETAPATTPLGALTAALGYLTFAERRAGRDASLEDILESPRAAQFCPFAADLTRADFGEVLKVYAPVQREVRALEDRLDRLTTETALDDLDIDQALTAWQADPTRPPEWFGDFVELSRTSTAPMEPEPDETLPNPVQALLEREPVADLGTPQPSEPAFNDNPEIRKIPAPLEVMDAESRIALYGTDNFDVNVQEDFAGTGGIRRIAARRNADSSLEVDIEGEIIPGRLPRKPARKKGADPLVPAPGQSWAPDLQSAGFRKLVEIPLRDPEQWERLHLWGPGFGDEAAAGIFLGPELINQVYQNRGIEALIRQLGRLVVPFRDHGYRLHCAASVTTWPDPTPAGFRLERVFRSVRYTVTLTCPGEDGARRHSAEAALELVTDPFYINQGLRPQVRLSADTAAWTQMFDLIPESLPDAG